MSQLQIQRLATRARRLFTLRGEMAVTPELQDSVVPVVVLEDALPEHLYLGGVRPWQAQHARSAVAGNRSRVQIFNPVDSRVIVVIQGFHVADFNTANLRPWQGIITDSILANNIATVVFRDTRGGIRALGDLSGGLTVQMRGEDSADVKNGTASMRSDNGEAFARFGGPYGPWIVLAPGTGLMLEPQVNAAGIQTSWWGYERDLERSEEQ